MFLRGTDALPDVSVKILVTRIMGRQTSRPQGTDRMKRLRFQALEVVRRTTTRIGPRRGPFRKSTR
jgi:hypothetical protein